MKTLITSLGIASMIIMLAGGAVYATEEISAFSFDYPYYSLKAPVSFFDDNALIMIYGPEEAVSINVIVQPEPDRNLEQYTAFSREQIKNLPDFKVEKEGIETINGVKFAFAMNNFKRDGASIKSKGIWTVFNKKAFVITYTAPEASFEKYLKTVESVFASFSPEPMKLSVPEAFVPKNSLIMGFGASTPEEFRINFNVIVKPEENKTLEQFTDFSKEEAKKIPGFTILSEGNEIYGGVKYYNVVHKFKQNALGLKARSAWAVSDKKVYIITYTSTEAAFDKYSKDIDYLCKSFVIKASK